jgi:hypothetical protein
LLSIRLCTTWNINIETKTNESFENRIKISHHIKELFKNTIYFVALEKTLSIKIYSQAKKSFFCALARKPVALLRGLCDKTVLGLAYYPSLKLDSFAWISPFGTYIVYNSTTQRWNIAVRNFRVKAESPALEDSLLLGVSIDALFQFLMYITIERLDQSHLYPNLEVPVLPAWEASTLEKSSPSACVT